MVIKKNRCQKKNLEKKFLTSIFFFHHNLFWRKKKFGEKKFFFEKKFFGENFGEFWRGFGLAR